jgi:hypothetical protein
LSRFDIACDIKLSSRVTPVPEVLMLQV